jgi:hypothetical protein
MLLLQVNKGGLSYVKKCLCERGDQAMCSTSDVMTVLRHSSTKFVDILANMNANPLLDVSSPSAYVQSQASTLYVAMYHSFVVHGLYNMIASKDTDTIHLLNSRIAPLDR